MRLNARMDGWVMAFVMVVFGGCGRVPATPDAGMDASPATCVANAFACGDDDALYQCDAEGIAQTKVQDCQYGCTGDRCNECEANTTFCSGDDLVECDGSGTIVNPQPCGFGCQMDRCNTCEPNAKYCMGATSVTCGANGEPAAMMSCGTAGCASGVCNSCTPNTTTCDGDTLVVCNGNGTVQAATTCSLGCGTTPNAHCKVLVPLYGVPVPSGTLPDLVIDANASLNISNCNALDVILTKGTQTTAVPATQLVSVVQNNGAPICVVRYNKITIAANVTLSVVNSASPGHLLSLQAVGDLDIAGTVAFINSAVGPSPGGAVETQGVNANSDHRAPGGGGGGGATAGGAGGAHDVSNSIFDYAGGAGGAAVTTAITSRLTGGSKGGDVLEGSTLRGIGGKGGGALHLVSLTRVLLAATAKIDLNGRGGVGTCTGPGSICTDPNLPTGGGGSGGSLVIEAPAISVSAGGIAAANGGGGGGACHSFDGLKFQTHSGQPGQLSAMPATGGRCGSVLDNLGDGGNGAAGTTMPGVGGNSDADCASVAGGGGGGAAGFILLRGRTQQSVMIDANAITSPPADRGSVTAN